MRRSLAREAALSMLEGLEQIERIRESIERSGASQHVRNARRECLLASRAVLDSIINTLEPETSVKASPARSIPITREDGVRD